jgi:hypothetical protein
LARWGDVNSGTNEFFRIPQRENDVNPNLKQNPGYELLFHGSTLRLPEILFTLSKLIL